MTDFRDPFDNIKDHPFDAALSQRYLVYALSTITARSLPDLRDGLKPVHRRLLWAMRLLRMEPSGASADVLVANPARNGTSYKKCARVVGDVIGKYHPHGDSSVYDAMVRLAQDFVLRTPLVDGQGNFGNIDGDNAAAMRYTEARLTQPAADLMAGLDEGTVDFRPTYNGEDEEPEVFPGLFPNLLANGASGIAVGMATSIPPHNVTEILDAASLLIDNPDTDHAALMAVVKGPDFPTGGVLVDSPAIIAEAYATGRGAFRTRARFSTGKDDQGVWEPTGIEKLSGGTWQLIVSEIPYQVQKGKLIEQIAALINDKKLPILEDVRDESDETIRIVITPRNRNVDPQVLKDSLYRLTDLENRFPLNLNVLDATHTPRVLGLRAVLIEWLKHQIDVLVRRAQHRLAKIADRLELLDGYIIAYLNLDRVIEIIRTEDEPKLVMMDEFALTDRQAEAILNMRLRSLRKLEEMELRREHADLVAEQEDLQKLVESPQRQRTKLKRDIAALRKRYGPDTALGHRRTLVEEAGPARDIPLEAMIEREPITVILSERGWIRAMSGHRDLAAADTLKFKEGDGPQFAFHAYTTDKLLLATSTGRVYTLGSDKLPGGRGFGDPVRSLVDMDNEGAIVAFMPARAGTELLLASSDGRGFIAAVAEIMAETRKGRQVVNVRTGAKLAVIRPVAPGSDSVAVIGENRKLLVFSLDEMPRMARGQGVQMQRYRDGGLSDAITFRLADGLSWAMGGETGRMRTESDMTPWKVARGAAGRMPPTGFPRDNRF
ncbi:MULTISPECIES: DNA topoisomerase IV subunit A [unclassified Sphingobium]|uniref:DNA topoisomerase IV subunit A n=1 Tax=unclassified Sphingobium TaxID=2611147 RepID=UPI000D1776B2|nr:MULTISPECIES: DNA topoisomerase IV subunit A [unclassified Sphingobium]MBG6116882.1 topoisomerase-4 subunit A [Sphingobium sp. JAI105]PSO12114.1 DNA topoisomerase IV subunit A [Sphingobium sp. AEW4]TWD02883.1 DNA topoisomerase IV subunit A [Sphingobium sp. AEW010]TWD20919.1 DNA topoisomerase IV subunit A [Sphingobium sp. AEW013]TWD23694.1 DNA topoisomerase IV subunit A [Sphingobium sp. AEW001]